MPIYTASPVNRYSLFSHSFNFGWPSDLLLPTESSKNDTVISKTRAYEAPQLQMLLFWNIVLKCCTCRSVRYLYYTERGSAALLSQIPHPRMHQLNAAITWTGETSKGTAQTTHRVIISCCCFKPLSSEEVGYAAKVTEMMINTKFRNTN